MIVDLVPNHTSDRHRWFVEALAAGPGAPARERYVFRDGRGADGALPPNDWEYRVRRPRLDRASPADGAPGVVPAPVRPRAAGPELAAPAGRATEFVDILRFWLDRGVDGFRVDVAHGLVKAAGRCPTGRTSATGAPPSAAPSTPLPFYDQDGVHEIYREWRAVLDALPAAADPASPRRTSDRPSGSPSTSATTRLHQAFNFEYLVTGWDAGDLRDGHRTHSARRSTGRRRPPDLGAVQPRRGAARHPVRDARGLSDRDAACTPAARSRTSRSACAAPAPRRCSCWRCPAARTSTRARSWACPSVADLPDGRPPGPGASAGGGTHAGSRDGCRVPIPWHGDARRTGSARPDAAGCRSRRAGRPTRARRQVGVAGSTLELYRAALRLRREHCLGDGTLEWLDVGPQVVAFVSGDVLVVANVAGPAVPLPAGWVPVLSSDPQPQPGSATVGTDVAVWAVRG